jgi:hypothetical protein
VSVRLEERRLLKGGLVLGAVGASIPVFYLSFLFVFGFQQAPRPVAETTPAPPLVKDALWARAEGGRATELRPINPVNMIGYVGCAESKGPDCSNWLPALRGIEYLSSLHLRDNQVERASFRGGAGAMSFTLFMTHSWTRDDFLNTLAARADFGYAWRGVEAAAQGFFGRPAAELTLPQAAFLASRVGSLNINPWCEVDAAMATRNRTLEMMRNNGAISDTGYKEALVVPLGLVPPPAGHRCA